MELPFGATNEDFESCKKIISQVFADHVNLNEITLQIMNIAYATGGDYSEQSILAYAKSYGNK